MNAARSYTVSESNEKIFVINYCCFSQLIERKKLSEHINKN